MTLECNLLLLLIYECTNVYSIFIAAKLFPIYRILCLKDGTRNISWQVKCAIFHVRLLYKGKLRHSGLISWDTRIFQIKNWDINKVGQVEER